MMSSRLSFLLLSLLVGTLLLVLPGVSAAGNPALSCQTSTADLSPLTHLNLHYSDYATQRLYSFTPCGALSAPPIPACNRGGRAAALCFYNANSTQYTAAVLYNNVSVSLVTVGSQLRYSLRDNTSSLQVVYNCANVAGAVVTNVSDAGNSSYYIQVDSGYACQLLPSSTGAVSPSRPSGSCWASWGGAVMDLTPLTAVDLTAYNYSLGSNFTLTPCGAVRSPPLPCYDPYGQPAALCRYNFVTLQYSAAISYNASSATSSELQALAVGWLQWRHDDWSYGTRRTLLVDFFCDPQSDGPATIDSVRQLQPNVSYYISVRTPYACVVSPSSSSTGQPQPALPTSSPASSGNVSISSSAAGPQTRGLSCVLTAGGLLYDLSSLRLQDLSFFNSSANRGFVITPCLPVSAPALCQGPNGEQAALCTLPGNSSQAAAAVLYVADSDASFTVLNTYWLRYQYVRSNSSLTVDYVCDDNASNAYINSAYQHSSQDYRLVVVTRLACPTVDTASSSSSSTGQPQPPPPSGSCWASWGGAVMDLTPLTAVDLTAYNYSLGSNFTLTPCGAVRSPPLPCYDPYGQPAALCRYNFVTLQYSAAISYNASSATSSELQALAVGWLQWRHDDWSYGTRRTLLVDFFCDPQSDGPATIDSVQQLQPNVSYYISVRTPYACVVSPSSSSSTGQAQPSSAPGLSCVIPSTRWTPGYDLSSLQQADLSFTNYTTMTQFVITPCAAVSAPPISGCQRGGLQPAVCLTSLSTGNVSAPLDYYANSSWASLTVLSPGLLQYMYRDMFTGTRNLTVNYHCDLQVSQAVIYSAFISRVDQYGRIASIEVNVLTAQACASQMPPPSSSSTGSAGGGLCSSADGSINMQPLTGQTLVFNDTAGNQFITSVCSSVRKIGSCSGSVLCELLPAVNVSMPLVPFNPSSPSNSFTLQRDPLTLQPFYSYQDGSQCAAQGGGQLYNRSVQVIFACSANATALTNVSFINSCQWILTVATPVVCPFAPPPPPQQPGSACVAANGVFDLSPLSSGADLSYANEQGDVFYFRPCNATNFHCTDGQGRPSALCESLRAFPQAAFSLATASPTILPTVARVSGVVQYSYLSFNKQAVSCPSYAVNVYASFYCGVPGVTNLTSVSFVPATAYTNCSYYLAVYSVYACARGQLPSSPPPSNRSSVIVQVPAPMTWRQMAIVGGVAAGATTVLLTVLMVSCLACRSRAQRRSPDYAASLLTWANGPLHQSRRPHQPQARRQRPKLRSPRSSDGGTSSDPDW